MNRILTSGFALLGASVVVTCGPSPGQQAGNGGRPGMHHGMDRMAAMGRMMQPQAPAPANAPASLSRFGCLPCHDIHSAGVGPAYAWVAWRYHDQAHAAQSLSVFIEHGGGAPGPV